MTHAILALMLALAQDVPTPDGKPAPPPPQNETPAPKGRAGCIGLGTGKGSSVGLSKGESAALGLRTKQDVAGTEQGEVHAIAEVAPIPSAAAPKQEIRLVYGFCAITDEWLPQSSGHYQRAELYLYRPGTGKEGGTRDEKTPKEEFYHAVLEHGRIVEEAGNRKLLKDFAALGADSWKKPFEKPDFKVAIPVDPNKIVMGILSRAVEDLVKGEKGKGDLRLKDRTGIRRDDSVKGAEGRDESRN